MIFARAMFVAGACLFMLAGNFQAMRDIGPAPVLGLLFEQGSVYFTNTAALTRSRTPVDPPAPVRGHPSTHLETRPDPA